MAYNPDRIRKYTAEYKETAAKMVLDTELGIGDVARKLSIPRTTLGKWVVKMHAARQQVPKTNVPAPVNQDEVAVLKQRVDALEVLVRSIKGIRKPLRTV